MKSTISLSRSRSQFFWEADALILSGRMSDARTLACRHSEQRGLKVDALIDLAEVFRRSGSPEHGLRVLYPIITPDRPRVFADFQFSHAVVEYAANLIRVGATSEARRWLASVDERQAPIKSLFEGFLEIHEWNFIDSIPHLEKASNDPRIRPYMRSIARLNAAQAYLYEGDYDRASDALSTLSEQSKSSELRLLRLTLLNLTALNESLNGNDLRTRQKALEQVKAECGFKESERDYDTFVYRKALAISELRNQGRTQAIRSLIVDAFDSGQSEIARDGDLRLALHQNDKDAIARIYFGTPFPAYRRTIERLAKQKGISIPELWIDSAATRLSQSWSIEGDLRFKADQLPDRLVRLLLSERYRKFTTTHLACEVLYDRHFHYLTSPQQVHQLIRRVRKQLSVVDPGFEILSVGDRYWLRTPKRLSIQHRKRSAGETTFGVRLRMFFGTREFSASEAMRALGVSQSQFWTRIQTEIQNTRISASTAGKNSRYRLIV